MLYHTSALFKSFVKADINTLPEYDTNQPLSDELPRNDVAKKDAFIKLVEETVRAHSSSEDPSNPRISLQLSLGNAPLVLAQQGENLVISWKTHTARLPDTTIAAFTASLQLNRWQYFYSYGLSDKERADLSFASMDLSSRDLSFIGSLQNINLSRARLSKSDLRGLDLRGARLREAKLRGANLSGADLGKADLYGADLSEANLNRAELVRADLSKAILSWTDLSHANLRKAHLNGARLYRTDLNGTKLSHADLTDATLDRPVINNTRIKNTLFTGATVVLNLANRWTEHHLDLYLNYEGNGHSLIRFIDSITGNDTLKLNLLRQIINKLTREKIEPGPYYRNFINCFQRPYTEDVTIAAFLKEKVARPFMDEISTGSQWIIQKPAVHEALLNYLESAPDFQDIVTRKNGFFIQLILNSRHLGGAVSRQAESLYTRYLELPRIKPYTEIDGLFGHESRPDWNDRHASNYILIADSEAEKRTLLISEANLAAMLRGDHASWSQFSQYLQTGAHAPENVTNDNIRALFNAHFLLFAAPYAAIPEQKNLIALLENLQLRQYQPFFAEALQSERSQEKLVTMEHQKALAEIFSSLLEGEDSTSSLDVKQVLQGTAQDAESVRIRDEHYEKILDIFTVKSATESEKAQILVCLSALFTRYSSSGIFGTGDDSPTSLRVYAWALLHKARELDADVVSDTAFHEWKNRLLGKLLTADNSAFTCSQILFEMMHDYAREHFRNILNSILPVYWRSAGAHLDNPDAADNQNVRDWRLPDRVYPQATDTGTAWEKQYIIQLEDDPVVAVSAARIASKHTNSVLIQLDRQGGYCVLIPRDGVWTPLSEEAEKIWLRQGSGSTQNKVRFQLVGYGRKNDISDSTNETFAGLTAQELAENLKIFSEETGQYPDHLSLVGCALTDNRNPLSSFAGQLMRSLKTLNISSLSARTEKILINEEGGKRAFTDTTGTKAERKSETLVFFWEDDELHYFRKNDDSATVRKLDRLADLIWKGKSFLRQLNRWEQSQLLTFLDAEQIASLSRRDARGQAMREAIRLLVERTSQGLISPEAISDGRMALQRAFDEEWDGYQRIAQENGITQDARAELEAGLIVQHGIQEEQKARGKAPLYFNSFQLRSLGLRARIIHFSEKFLGSTSKAVMAIGTVAALYRLQAIELRLADKTLNPVDRAKFETEKGLVQAELSVDWIQESTELTSKLLFRPMPDATTQPSPRSLVAGIKIPGFVSGISTLSSFIATGFAWYGIHQSAQELKKLVDSTDTSLAEEVERLRINLGVNIATTLISTGMTVSSAVAFVGSLGVAAGSALSGVSAAAASFMAVAGPVGGAILMGAFVGLWIYNGVKTVEDFSRYMSLTGWEKFKVSAGSLFGAVPEYLQAEYDFQKLKAQLEKTRLAEQQALLQHYPDVDVLYQHAPRALRARETMLYYHPKGISITRKTRVSTENAAIYVDMDNNQYEVVKWERDYPNIARGDSTFFLKKIRIALDRSEIMSPRQTRQQVMTSPDTTYQHGRHLSLLNHQHEVVHLSRTHWSNGAFTLSGHFSRTLAGGQLVYISTVTDIFRGHLLTVELYPEAGIYGSAHPPKAQQSLPIARNSVLYGAFRVNLNRDAFDDALVVLSDQILAIQNGDSPLSVSTF